MSLLAALNAWCRFNVSEKLNKIKVRGIVDSSKIDIYSSIRHGSKSIGITKKSIYFALVSNIM